MSDQELLERAAKAYWGEEIDDVCSIRWLDADQAIGYTHGDNQDHNGQDVEWLWNPLTDDGDAFRLIVKLRLTLKDYAPTDEVPTGMIESGRESDIYPIHTEWYPPDADRYATTRRAIVRAAASIGAAL